MPHVRHYEVYEDEAKPGEWRWRKVAGNDEITSDSGEGYVSQWNAERAVDSDNVEHLPVFIFPREQTE
jgi:uncharacterized protein YegP (UPF0339 family)